MDINFIERLEREMEEELPGRVAQHLMAPIHRIQETEDIPDDHILACVLLLLYPKNKEWHLALIERVSHNTDDVHAGQLSLPGGRFEDSDYSYQDCALREAEEEIGIQSGDVGVLGELSSLYIPVSNYLIYPFVGFMGEEPDFSIQKNEVQDLVHLPIKKLLDGKNKRRADIEARGATIADVPFYDLHNIPLWGATAMILSEFEQVVKKVI
jgi:8-oxo-dGTP pyrophosphatase MutT (NUDIX family)